MGALGNNLQLLVENQGRVNYLLAEDFKVFINNNNVAIITINYLHHSILCYRESKEMYFSIKIF